MICKGTKKREITLKIFSTFSAFFSSQNFYQSVSAVHQGLFLTSREARQAQWAIIAIKLCRRRYYSKSRYVNSIISARSRPKASRGIIMRRPEASVKTKLLPISFLSETSVERKCSGAWGDFSSLSAIYCNKRVPSEKISAVWGRVVAVASGERAIEK